MWWTRKGVGVFVVVVPPIPLQSGSGLLSLGLVITDLGGFSYKLEQ